MKFTDLTSIPSYINAGIACAKQLTMKTVLGNPRTNYTTECLPVTNAELLKHIVTEDVGPFKVTGYKLAVDSLRIILTEVKENNLPLYNSLNSAGMLCVRLVRGSTSGAISNHSWGTAIDIKINGALDARGNDKVQYGLALLAPYFNKHGWFWGAGFSTEDAMHFEVGDDLIRKMLAAKIGRGDTLPGEIGLGDRGPEVRYIQECLSKKGFNVDVDGVYGMNTKTHIMEIQKKYGLSVDGIVGSKTLSVVESIFVN